MTEATWIMFVKAGVLPFCYLMVGGACVEALGESAKRTGPCPMPTEIDTVCTSFQPEEDRPTQMFCIDTDGNEFRVIRPTGMKS